MSLLYSFPEELLLSNSIIYCSENNLRLSYPNFSLAGKIVFSNMDGINHGSCITTLLLLKAKPHENCLKGKEWNMGKHGPIITSCEG